MSCGPIRATTNRANGPLPRRPVGRERTVVDDRDQLVTALRAAAGDDLRAVATYDADGYDAFYVRDDVASCLADVAEDLHDDLIL